MSIQLRQTQIKNQMPELENIFQRHEFSLDWLDELAPLINKFEIRVPLIGAFSCGKSSLINALLKQRLLPTAITPETALPAEIRFGEHEQYLGCKPGQKPVMLEACDLHNDNVEVFQPDGWLEVTSQASQLSQYPQLVLVDLPGWSSGVAAHEQVIDNYVKRSLAYCVVVNVEDGALRDSLRKALIELAIAQMPIVLVVSKADKRPDSDVQKVTEQIVSDIEKIMGKAPLAVAVTSARKKKVDQLEAALELLNTQAGDVFEQRVVSRYQQELASVASKLEILSNKKYEDAERIKAEIEQQKQKDKAFDVRLQQETDKLQAEVDPIVNSICVRTENALASRLDMLASRALDGQDISDDILSTARLEISKTLHQEFEPLVKRFLDRLADALPNRLDININLAGGELGGQANNDLQMTDLLGLLAPLLIKIPHPIAKVLAPVGALLLSLLGNDSAKQQQAVEQARQRDSAKQSVRAAIGSALKQIEQSLRPVLEQQIQKAQEEVTKTIESERSQLRKTLDTLIDALNQGEQETAKLREQAEKDKNAINQFIAELANKGGNNE